MSKWVNRKPKKKFKKDDLIIEKLAKIRGIEDLDGWLNPPSSVVNSAYLLSKIDEAVQKIVNAVYKELKIVIMADIDADGVSSCAIMYNYLKDITQEDKLEYIHTQRSRGHGVETVIEGFIPLTEKQKKEKIVVKYIPEDTDLLIIVDSSSNSVEGCKYIKEEMGIDIVIIDHHQVDKDNPYATIVNCQLDGYPNPALSGSAMTYKVCQVLDDYLAIEKADEFLDLCAVGLIGDMMSVENMENRYLISKGLNSITNTGLQLLFKKSKVNIEYDPVSTTTVSFKISPAISSCTRFDKIELALTLLTSDDPKEVDSTAKEMVKLNEQRKKDESAIVEMAMSKVDNRHKVAVLIDNEIGSGFRGLVAMQLVQKLNKPVFVLTEIMCPVSGKTRYGGSARTLGFMKLKEMCTKTKEFNFCQGHEGAFGVDIEQDKLEKALVKLDKMIKDEDLIQTIYYDLEVDVNDLDEMDIKDVEKFSKICGQGFAVPKFKVTGLVAEGRDVLGKGKDTIKVICEGMNLMKFKTDDTYASDVVEALEDEETFMVELEAVGTLNVNKFYNFKYRQLEVSNQCLIDDYKLV